MSKKYVLTGELLENKNMLLTLNMSHSVQMTKAWALWQASYGSEVTVTSSDTKKTVQG